MSEEYVTLRRQCGTCKGAGTIGLRHGASGLVIVERVDANGVEQTERCDTCGGMGWQERAVTLYELLRLLLEQGVGA